MIFGVMRSMMMYYFVTSLMKGAVNKPNGGAGGTGGADVVGDHAAMNDGAEARGPMENAGARGRPPPARPLYLKGEPIDVYAYITHEPVFTEYGDADLMVAHEESIPLCGSPEAGGDNGERRRADEARVHR